MPQLGPIKVATVVVPDLDGMAGAFADHLNYRRIAEGPLDPAIALAWGAPKAAGARTACLLPQSGEGTILRFIERPGVAGFGSMKTFGWNALEILVQDPDALAARLNGGSPFRMIGAPADLPGSGDIRATQFMAPCDVCVYLTRIGPIAASRGLHQARTEVDRVFVVILGTSRLDATLAFYRDTLGAEMSPGGETRMTVLSGVHGLPRETRHRYGLAMLGSGYLLEIDQYPPTTAPRRANPDDLPPGIVSLGFAAGQLPAGQPPEGAGPVYRDDFGAGPVDAVYLRGPDDEGIELLAIG